VSVGRVDWERSWSGNRVRSPFIAAAPTSKRDLAKIQEQFNAWSKETGLPYRHISLI
jgi:hypothetical protein